MLYKTGVASRTNRHRVFPQGEKVPYMYGSCPPRESPSESPKPIAKGENCEWLLPRRKGWSLPRGVPGGKTWPGNASGLARKPVPPTFKPESVRKLSSPDRHHGFPVEPGAWGQACGTTMAFTTVGVSLLCMRYRSYPWAFRLVSAVEGQRNRTGFPGPKSGVHDTLQSS
jgi:hypothetical protein